MSSDFVTGLAAGFSLMGFLATLVNGLTTTLSRRRIARFHAAMDRIIRESKLSGACPICALDRLAVERGLPKSFTPPHHCVEENPRALA